MSERNTRGGAVAIGVLWALLCALPAAYLLAMIMRYKLEAPKAEQWYFLFTIERFLNGTLKFADLWQQEAEHRHLFPYLVMLPLARISRWSLTPEYVVNVLLAAGTWAAIAWHMLKLGASRWGQSGMSVLQWPGDAAAALVALFASVALFSVSQFECWLWSFEMVTFMNVTAAVWGMALLAHPQLRGWHVGAGVVLGVVAHYSFANGLMYWLAGGAVLVAQVAWRRDERDRKRAAVMIGGWIAAAVVTSAIFFYEYKLREWSDPKEVILGTPGKFLRFIVIFLGTPAAMQHAGGAAIAGVLVLVAMLLIAILLLRRGGRSELLLPLGLVLYVVPSAAAIAAGRANIGDPTSPRYITTSCLLWIAFAMLVGALSRRAGAVARRLMHAVLLVLIGIFVAQYLPGARGFRWYSKEFRPGQEQLLRIDVSEPKWDYKNVASLSAATDPILKIMPWEPPVRMMVTTLQKNRLNVFSDRSAELSAATASEWCEDAITRLEEASTTAPVHERIRLLDEFDKLVRRQTDAAHLPQSQSIRLRLVRANTIAEAGQSRAALTILDTLLEELSSETDNLDDLDSFAYTTLCWADIHYRIGNYLTALHGYENVRTSITTLYRKQYSDYLDELAGGIVAAAVAVGKTTSVLEMALQLVRLSEESTQPQHLPLHATALAFAATALEYLSGADKASTYSLEAIREAEAHLKANPSNSFAKRVAIWARFEHANILARSRELAAATEQCTSAITESLHLIEADPRSVDIRSDLAWARASLGDMLLRQDRCAEAIRQYEQSGAEFQHLIKVDPMSSYFKDSWLYACVGLAKAYERMGRQDEARDLLKSAGHMLDVTRPEPSVEFAATALELSRLLGRKDEAARWEGFLLRVAPGVLKRPER